MTRQMFGIAAQTFGEHQPLRSDSACGRPPLQISSGPIVVSEEPQHTAGNCPQEPHPDVEDGCIDLVRVVETAEDKTVRWKTALRSRWRPVCNLTFPVVALVAFWQVDELLTVGVLIAGRHHVGVDDCVVDEWRPGGPWISEIGYLDRRRAVDQCENAPVLGMASEIDEDVDLGFRDPPRKRSVSHRANIDEDIERRLEAPTLLATIVGAG